MNKKHTIGVVVTEEMRDRVKRVAELKHWSVSQTIALFMAEHWDRWEAELGVDTKPSPAPTGKTKKSKT